MIRFKAVLSMRVFANISKEALLKKRIWVNIESLVFIKELSTKRVHLWLLNKGQFGKKSKFIATSRPHKQDSEYLENSVWICVHANGLGVVLLDIWFLCSCGK